MLGMWSRLASSWLENIALFSASHIHKSKFKRLYIIIYNGYLVRQTWLSYSLSLLSWPLLRHSYHRIINQYVAYCGLFQAFRSPVEGWLEMYCPATGRPPTPYRLKKWRFRLYNIYDDFFDNFWQITDKKYIILVTSFCYSRGGVCLTFNHQT
jgi:hypothetical protein